MSEPIDKQASEEQLNEYLQGDSLVSRQYRHLSADEVPAELDHLVLRQAHDAVKAPPARSRKHLRWAAPLALAASAVLVVSIVIETGVQRDVVMTGAPVSAPVAEQAESLRKQRDEAADNAAGGAPVPLEMPRAREKKEQEVEVDLSAKSVPPPYVEPPMVSMDLPAEASSAPAPAVAPPPPAPQIADSVLAAEQTSTTTVQSAENDQRALSSYSAPIVSSPALREDKAEVAKASAGSAEQRAQRSPVSMQMDPERWLQRIRDLRKADRKDEADAEWRRFRQMFPDYPVSEVDVAREVKK